MERGNQGSCEERRMTRVHSRIPAIVRALSSADVRFARLWLVLRVSLRLALARSGPAAGCTSRGTGAGISGAADRWPTVQTLCGIALILGALRRAGGVCRRRD